MDVMLNWKGRMSFEGAGKTGFVQKMDADESVGGNNSAANPMEYLALGLGGCTGMDVISILQKKKQAVTDFQVKVHAERSPEHPKVFTHAVIEYVVTGKNIQEVAVVRAIELSAEKYCPAQAMLNNAFPIQMIYKIFDEDGKTLIKNGEYILKSTSEY
ncbi:MAG: OsmC family protein [Anaerolineales bacterium]|nr:OsmC family protein [Anaerolineales bacterium]